MASEVYAACALDQDGVQLGRACDQARVARDGAIIAERFAAMIGDGAAGLLDDEGRRGDVPFALRRQGNGGVGLARGHEREPVGDGIDPARINLGPRLLPDTFLEQAATRYQPRTFEPALAADMNGCLVEEGAVPSHRMEELSARRIEHDAADTVHSGT